MIFLVSVFLFQDITCILLYVFFIFFYSKDFLTFTNQATYFEFIFYLYTFEIVNTSGKTILAVWQESAKLNFSILHSLKKIPSQKSFRVFSPISLLAQNKSFNIFWSFRQCWTRIVTSKLIVLQQIWNRCQGSLSWWAFGNFYWLTLSI